MAHQMAIISKVLKSDMEAIMCSRQARVDETGNAPLARTTEVDPALAWARGRSERRYWHHQDGGDGRRRGGRGVRREGHLRSSRRCDPQQ